jgi:hypothetical protein
MLWNSIKLFILRLVNRFFRFKGQYYVIFVVWVNIVICSYSEFASVLRILYVF